MAFAIYFARINAALGGIGHRVYGLSNANILPFIFVQFRGVFPYKILLEARGQVEILNLCTVTLSESHSDH